MLRIVSAAAGEVMNSIAFRARALLGELAPMAAMKFDTFCRSGGSGVMWAMPFTGSYSLIC